MENNVLRKAFLFCLYTSMQRNLLQSNIPSLCPPPHSFLLESDLSDWCRSSFSLWEPPDCGGLHSALLPNATGAALVGESQANYIVCDHRDKPIQFWQCLANPSFRKSYLTNKAGISVHHSLTSHLFLFILGGKRGCYLPSSLSPNRTLSSWENKDTCSSNVDKS